MLNQSERVRMTAEVAIMAALGIGLDYLFGVLTGGLFVYGGSISIAIVPIMLISFRRGIGPGLVTGLLVGTLQLIFGGHILQFVQMIFDYPVPFMVVGFAGVLAKRSGELNTKTLVWGGILGGMLRYLSHFVAGVTFWRTYVPTDPFLGIQGFNAFTWSIFYNGLYMIPTIIVSVVVLVVLFKTAPQLFDKDKL